jgi:parallel beta-helix repeat protein
VGLWQGGWVHWRLKPRLGALQRHETRLRGLDSSLYQCKANKETGLLYGKEGAGSAERNICEGNGWDGIRVEHDATPVLRDNIFRANTMRGLSYFYNASGSAERTLYERNGQSGILLWHDAAPRLEENVIIDNGSVPGYNGIFVRKRSKPLLSRNRIERNSGPGICVERTAEPILDGNISRDNKGRDRGVRRLLGR